LRDFIKGSGTIKIANLVNIENWEKIGNLKKAFLNT
jgi:hypothetical protein